MANEELKIVNNLEVPFKNFQNGKVLEPVEFNDDFKDIENKVNEIILKHNALVDLVTTIMG